MSYGLDIHPAVVIANIQATTPRSRRKHRPQRYGWPMTICLFLIAASVAVFGGLI